MLNRLAIALPMREKKLAMAPKTVVEKVGRSAGCSVSVRVCSLTCSEEAADLLRGVPKRGKDQGSALAVLAAGGPSKQTKAQARRTREKTLPIADGLLVVVVL